MREILFRGKGAETGEWVFGCVNVMRNNNTYIFRFSQQFEVLPETVGQFTGFVDMNGKKIFEGDILRVVENMATFTACSSWKGVSTSVSAWTNKFNHEVEFTASGLTLVDYWERMAEVVEVIGNIHDNPELLK